MRLFLLYAVAPLAAALPAHAQDSAVASTQIHEGEHAAAETRLLAEMRIHPNRPELLLNLATVYARTDRADAARALYQRVLAQDDVVMTLAADRTAGSHAIARTGLRRLGAVQVTAR
jgi:hypothetical protein